MGKIYDLAREHIPVTWDAIASNTKYGVTLFENKIEFVKYKLFSTVGPTDSTYNILQQNYIAKETVIQVIPTAIDYWKEKEQSIVTTGTNETVSYSDRISALEKLRNQLITELKELQLYMGGIVNTKRHVIPRYNTPTFVTPSPDSFPKQESCSDPIINPWLN